VSENSKSGDFISSTLDSKLLKEGEDGSDDWGDLSDIGEKDEKEI
jgi:hypothetical protein